MSKLNVNIHQLLTQEMIKVLTTKQIITIENFLDQDSLSLVNITRLRFKDILTIKRAIIKQYSAYRLNAFDYYQETLKNCAIFSTGIPNVDSILDGGLFTGNIYEICGLPACGKTQFVLTIIANVITKNFQQLQQIYYIDTKNNCVGIRLRQLLEKRQNNVDKYLERVVVFNTITRYELYDVLLKIKQNLENNLKLRLIVIDALPTLFLNINDQIDNNIYLNRIIKLLHRITVKYHIVIIVINLLNSWKDENYNGQRTMCGKYWKSIPNVRLKINKRELNQLQLSIIDGDFLTINKNCKLNITDEGIK